jgi:drug/metabolite transporter superfamily protein YnfA
MNGLLLKRSHLRISAALAVAALTARVVGAAPAQQAYIKASNTGAGDWLGYAVAVSGDTMVVGAIYETSNATGVNGNQSDNSAVQAGAAYVFVRTGTIWSQQAYLKASNTDANDRLGRTVAISGDTVVVGATGEASNATGVNGDQSDNSAPSSGAAYVFVRSGTNWTQQAYLKPSNTDAGDQFGVSVSVSGDTAVVGAYHESSNATGVDGNQTDSSATNSGAVYVFVRNRTNWSQQAYLKASNTGTNDEFGHSVAVSGDTVVVGAAYEDSNATGVNGNQSDESTRDSGAAYVFVRSGTNWRQQAYLKASNTGLGDQFGHRVAVSGDTVLIGAYVEASNATGVNGNQTNNSAGYSGAGYVFVRTGTTWSQQAYLKASNTDLADQFGSSVAVSGDTVVLGAPQESSSATGVNGNQSNNSTANAGAAYVFIRRGTNWSQQAYLKASNTGANDYFGWSAAVSGDTVVVSAWLEDSNATGVNGNQFNNSATDSGAAYVFTGLGIGPRLALAPDGSGGYFIRFTGAPDVTYRLQRATSVTGPWDTIATLTAPASVFLEYHDTPRPPGQAFYRAAQP